jgi:CRISPR-associated DxTHG motif protein
MSEQPELHVLLTTIGTSRYTEARYMFAGESAPRVGKFFPALLCDHLKESGSPVQKAVVLLTKKAKEDSNWQGDAQVKGLRQHLEERGIEIIEADIENGDNEEELWEIFKAVGEKIPKGAAVTLDVTHGFRSLQMVMLLACAYYNTSGNFELKSVYYGAFVDSSTRSKPAQPTAEQPATEQPAEEKLPQAVDLTPMITLFEWASAVDAFKRSGSLRQMAELLKGNNPVSQSDVEGKLSHQMRKLTDALELGRLRNIAQPIREIRHKAKALREQAKPRVTPFVDQLDSVLDELRRFDVSFDESDVDKWLAAQFRLVKWYKDKRHYMQAVLLLHEWVISYAASKVPSYRAKGIRSIFEERSIRDETSRRLDEATNKRKELGRVVQLVTELSKELEALPDGLKELIGLPAVLTLNTTSELQGIWDSLTQLRNTVAHLGHHQDARKADEIEEDLEELIRKLQPLVPGTSPAE